VSFVNSIATTRGGSHVNHVSDQLATLYLDYLAKKHKGCVHFPFLSLILSLSLFLSLSCFLCLRLIVCVCVSLLFSSLARARALCLSPSLSHSLSLSFSIPPSSLSVCVVTLYYDYFAKMDKGFVFSLSPSPFLFLFLCVYFAAGLFDPHSVVIEGVFQCPTAGWPFSVCDLCAVCTGWSWSHFKLRATCGFLSTRLSKTLLSTRRPRCLYVCIYIHLCACVVPVK